MCWEISCSSPAFTSLLTSFVLGPWQNCICSEILRVCIEYDRPQQAVGRTLRARKPQGLWITTKGNQPTWGGGGRPGLDEQGPARAGACTESLPCVSSLGWDSGTEFICFSFLLFPCYYSFFPPCPCCLSLPWTLFQSLEHLSLAL